jgi:hypothetical protein
MFPCLFVEAYHLSQQYFSYIVAVSFGGRENRITGEKHRPVANHRDRRGSDQMIVGFTTICAISAHHH